MDVNLLLRLRERFAARRGLNATRVVALSFAGIILLGALLLTLPIASKDMQSAGFFTGLFTATSSTCVTGLILVDTGVQWSLFGQIVILLMLQIGGLGLMTIITIFSLALHRRIGLSERLVMVSTLNLNDMEGVVRVVRHALMGTFIIEGIGAVLMATRFIPKLGLAEGIWASIFHAVSAFCNGGFDVVGEKYGAFSSLAGLNNDPVILLTTGGLIVIGGLGFFVWEDVIRAKSWKKLSLYSRTVLTVTFCLILGGMLFVLAAEYNNPATLGDMPLWQKVLNALFQSITLRTAGFDSIGQGGMTDETKAVSIMLMLIGGSSGSTAGGIKTVTVAVLLLTLRASLRGREQVTIRRRTIPASRVMTAMSLTLMILSLFFVGSIVITTLEGLPYIDCAFETASALATVGVTAGITTTLGRVSQSILILFMYLGRVGVFSASVAFAAGRKPAKIQYPSAELMIG